MPAMNYFLINTITKYRKRSIQSLTTKSLFLQRTLEQKPAISIVVSVCLLSLVKTCLIHYSIILNLTTV